ncbi:MAG: SulP family inorganic anion transporter [Gammaproteobacteria bacterium]
MNVSSSQSRLPLLSGWPPLNRHTLRADLWAGLTGAVIVLPQGVAFALLAGLPPEYGIYTSIVPAIVAALFGSSWHLVSGPTTAISIVVFSTLSVLAPAGSGHFIQLAVAVACMTGVMQLVLGLARLGALVNFVSHTVIAGFTAGAAILIVASQLKPAFGIAIPADQSFLQTWLSWYRQLDETNLYVLSIALSTLLAALAVRAWRPRWPVTLIAMTAGAVLSLALDGAAHGVPLVGALPAQLPRLSPPDISLTTLRELAPSALAIALLGLVEASSIARAVALRSGQRIDGNREFIAQGLSNLAGSFFSCYPASGSFTRTGVNYMAGARSPLAAIAAAFILMLILWLAAPVAAYLPMPAIAGVLVLIAWNLIDFRHIYHILRTDRAESAILLTTFAATLFLDLAFAIYAGVLLSLVLYLNRASKPNIVSLAPDPKDPRRRLVNMQRKPVPECPQLKILRIDGSLFFGSTDYVYGKFRELAAVAPQQRHLLLVGSGINMIDLAGCELLAREGDRRRAAGGSLSLVGLRRRARTTLERSGAPRHLHRIYTSKHEALASLFEMLDKDICAHCTRRIFTECAQAPMTAETEAKLKSGCRANGSDELNDKAPIGTADQAR